VNARNSTLARPEERTLVITRIFDAPPSLVYKAWTEREHMLRWPAPHGFTITYGEAEVRPGGAWRSCMRAPDGVEHWVSGVYREVVKDKRLVFTHAWDGADGKPGHETVVTLTFEEHNGKTRFTLHQAFFDSVESRDGHQSGWSQGLERLTTLLAEMKGELA